jgi:hypothetical protein
MNSGVCCQKSSDGHITGTCKDLTDTAPNTAQQTCTGYKHDWLGYGNTCGCPPGMSCQRDDLCYSNIVCCQVSGNAYTGQCSEIVGSMGQAQCTAHGNKLMTGTTTCAADTCPVCEAPGQCVTKVMVPGGFGSALIPGCPLDSTLSNSGKGCAVDTMFCCEPHDQCEYGDPPSQTNCKVSCHPDCEETVTPNPSPSEAGCITGNCCKAIECDDVSSQSTCTVTDTSGCFGYSIFVPSTVDSNAFLNCMNNNHDTEGSDHEATGVEQNTFSDCLATTSGIVGITENTCKASSGPPCSSKCEEKNRIAVFHQDGSTSVPFSAGNWITVFGSCHYVTECGFTDECNTYFEGS